MKLQDPTLFRTDAYINGAWVSADSGATTDVTNPATGEVMGTVPLMGAAETDRAITAASEAFKSWRSMLAKERSAVVRRWSELLLENAEDLALLMTTEQGKSINEARGEINYSAGFFEWFAEEAKRTYGDVIPQDQHSRRIVTIRQPVGVVGSITPWNFPIAMISRKAGPAVASGCTFIAKPAPETPFSALAMAVLAERAGVPAGVFNVVTGDAENITSAMMASDDVRKITFTGSTRVGKILYRQSADTVKKISLELGGNAPFLVFDDADVDAAVEGAIASKFRNSGQTCVCANRFYVQSGIYDEFVEKLAVAVGELKVGPGINEDTTQGPLITPAALEKVERHVKDAVDNGGRVVVGGKPHELGGTYYQPTLVADATQDMLIAREETFGPLAPIIKVETEEEAIAYANDTEFGLAAYFYSQDINRIWRVAEQLESGLVGINAGIISTEIAPFGGFKQSGLGKEGSKYGMDEYTELKYLSFGSLG
jgi:succinate-semialdehyde dehydrogenase/glutarate-semialdehyde dehydrogenase